MEKAWKALFDARVNYEHGLYVTALNRAYYAVFYAMRAANSLYRFDSKKHSGVISFFQREFLKTELLDKSLSHVITETYTYRGRADYEDLYEPGAIETAMQLENAEQFVAAVAAFLEPYINNESTII